VRTSITDETDPTSIDESLNMYNPDNGPPYSGDFVEHYRAAQIARNNRITDWCYAELERLKALNMSDRAFNLYRTWADLRLMDGTIDPSDNTLRTWLSMWSLRDSHCRGAPHLARITQPSLVIQSKADTGVFPGDAKAIYAALGASNKKLEMIEGDHYLQHPDNARDAVADMLSDWLSQQGV